MNGEKDSAGQIHSPDYSLGVPKQSNNLSHQDLIVQKLSTVDNSTMCFWQDFFLSGFNTG